MKKILIILAIISIVIISTIQILSLFSGEHYFYNMNDKNCLKCHSDIQTEIDHSDYHKSLTCEECHIIINGSGNISHADIKNPRCLDCHLSFKNDSHDPLILSAISSKVYKGENEACISCHTKRSIDIKFTYADTYSYLAKRNTGIGTWQISGSKDVGQGVTFNIKSGEGKGEHSFSKELSCEKCHLDVRNQLNISTFHSDLSCKDCHLMNTTRAHASYTPLCADCHIISKKSNDAHTLDINGNSMCSSCHSSFNNKIEYTRPEYLEWDVVNVTDSQNNSKWLIENLDFGPSKSVLSEKNQDGKLHNISKDVDCVSCHQDIKDAVIKGGHSNEQWEHKHNYGSNMNAYCRSCHFSSTNHGGAKISCLDCHNINNEDMGHVGESMAQQKSFVQSYLCMACKNTNNPSPYNNSLHFKFYTEPDVTIYVNGVKRYP